MDSVNDGLIELAKTMDGVALINLRMEKDPNRHWRVEAFRDDGREGEAVKCHAATPTEVVAKAVRGEWDK